MEDDADAFAAMHLKVWHLIPWFVNGTVGQPDQHEVQAHLAMCEDCRDELALQRHLQQHLHAGPADGGDERLTAEPGIALQALWARIDDEDALMTPAVNGPSPSVSSRWTRWLAVAVVVQAVGLTALIGLLWPQRRGADADYVTLSQAPAAPSAAVIRLVPSPSLRLAQLQALLKAADLRIADSNADGSILGLAPRHAPSAPRLDDALARLRADAGVLLAEPIGAPALPAPVP